MQFRLRTLLIVLAVGPPLLALLLSIPRIVLYANAWSLAIDGIYVDRNGKIISTSEPPPSEALVKPSGKRLFDSTDEPKPK